MLTDSTINVYFETINQPILVGFLEWCLWHLQSRWWFQPKHRGVVDFTPTKMRCWTRNRWVVGCASMILLGMFLLIPHVDFPKKTLEFLLGMLILGDKSWMIIFLVTSEELGQLEKTRWGYVWFRIWGYGGMGCCYTQWNVAWKPKNTATSWPCMAKIRLHLEVLEPFLSHQTGHLLLA